MYSKRSEYTGECQSCRCIKCDLTKFTTESGTVTALTLYPSTDLFSMTGTWAVCGGSLQGLPAMGAVLLFMGQLQAPNLHKAMQLLTCFCHTTNLIFFSAPVLLRWWRHSGVRHRWTDVWNGSESHGWWRRFAGVCLDRYWLLSPRWALVHPALYSIPAHNPKS